MSGKNRKSTKFSKPKLRAKELLTEFLESLLFAIESVGMHNINRHQAYSAFGRVDGKLTASDNCRILNRLRRAGYVEAKGQSNSLSIEFTGKAKMKIIDKIASHLSYSTNYHFVSFDIPELLSSNRNRFRIAIKKMGFMRIQQSLWVSNREIGELVQFAAFECEVEKYVVYIVSAKSDIDGILDSKFDQK